MSWSVEGSYIPRIEIPSERTCGVGSIFAEINSRRVMLPLADVKINAQIASQVASVVMKQTFENPYQEHLEAVYIFPLPGGAAVSDFEMRIGSKIVKGKVEERAEARRQYQEAINQGKRAALMEKERDDVFTLQLGNLPPGQEITIAITYSEKLIFFEDGTTEIRLPLVVAPRYIPGQSLYRDPVGDGIEPDTNIVTDASRISPPRLAKNFDPKISLSIETLILWDDTIDGGELRNLCCSQHATRTSAGKEGVKVSLARQDEALDRDFVLRWTLSNAKLRTSLLVYRDSYSEAYGMLSIIPPSEEGRYNQARDVVFIVDRSGSMQGIKMASAARACALLLKTLGPQDRFAIQSFSNGVEWLNPNYSAYGRDNYFIPADYYGLEQGERYLRGINAAGGTEIYKALVEAMKMLEQRRDSYRRVPVIVLLTDGEVGNESQVLKEAQQRLGVTRLFTIGIDTAVNQGFLQHLANVGSGTATFVTPGSQLEDALVNVGREIGSPLVVNLRLEDVDSGLDISAIAPSKIPDLFNGRASSAFFVARNIGRIRVRGQFIAGGDFDIIVNPQEVFMSAIAQLWAKERITDLEDRYRVELSSQERLKREIISLSTRFNILTRFTAFIAVDHSEIVNHQGYQRHVVQPVEMPADWQAAPASTSYEQASKSNCATKSIRTRGDYLMQEREIADTAKRKESIVSKSSNRPMAPQVPQSAPPRPAAPPARPIPPAEPMLDRRQSKSESFGQIEGVVPASKKVDVAKPQPSIVEKAIDAVKGLFNTGVSNSQPINALPTNERELIELAIKTLQDTYSDVMNGYAPSPERLDQIRSSIINLTNTLLKQNLPKFFRFFEVEVYDLVGGLRRQTPKPIFEQHQYIFQQVVVEVKNYFASPSQPSNRKDGSFWDSNI
ncbi:MAG: VWA domain-containing protein [Blastocatellia bacterium]|nr:VWA domain-containing protein [Blastocatellia bacterium]